MNTFEKPKRYNIKDSAGMWVVFVGDLGVMVSARRSEAKAFTEAEIVAWKERGFEAVEIVNPFGLEGKVTAPKLEGF